MAEITRQVGASTDDIYRSILSDLSQGAVALATGRIDSRLWIGSWYDPQQWCEAGMRFLNITIPKGSTINSAKLTLQANEDRSGATVNVKLSAEAADNPSTFTDDIPTWVSRITNTTAKVEWNAIGAWTVPNDYDSPDIKTVIQAITDRAGWASGQAIVIFMEDRDLRSDVLALRMADSWDGDVPNAPKLYIAYTPPVVGWTGKISGVTNPAKIMGVDVANIAKVKGV